MQFVIHVSFTTNMTSFWFASQLIAHKMRNLRLPNLFYLLNIPIALPIIAQNSEDTFYVPTLVNYFHRQRREPISLWSFTFFIGNKELYECQTTCKLFEYIYFLSKIVNALYVIHFIMILIYLFYCLYVSVNVRYCMGLEIIDSSYFLSLFTTIMLENPIKLTQVTSYKTRKYCIITLKKLSSIFIPRIWWHQMWCNILACVLQ